MNAPERHVPLGQTQAAVTVPYTISVRSLCEFAAKDGDLDLRFTPSPTSQEGIAGHREVQSHRGDSYRGEVPVQGAYANLVVRGRADGFDAAQGVLEEIKTCVGDASKIPANHRRLHWAQAKVYGALLCRQYDLSGITVALVYFDIRDQRELPRLAEYHTADALDAYFVSLCERFIAWAESESAHRVSRDDSLASLAFPHSTFRTGQRDLAKSVFNAARAKTRLLAQAPTGIGKTLATLFPMLKACPREALDKVYFLTAKGSGKALASSALDTLHRAHPDLRLRTIELTAREKSCEHPDKACHPESCPLARGFYDRLPAARASAAKRPLLTKDVLREIALTHGICPYYLAQEMTRWCDVVIADYNHYFDRSALLHDLAQENGWRVALLIDEAHNLLDRARAMYSASLDSERLRDVLRIAPPRVASSVKRLRKQWNRVARVALPSNLPVLRAARRSPLPPAGEGLGERAETLASVPGQKSAANRCRRLSRYNVLPAPPEALQLALQDVTGTLSEHFADEPTRPNTDLLGFYFDALAFERAIVTFGAHSMFDVQVHGNVPPASKRGRTASSIGIRNIVPASFLAPRFVDAHCAVLFSATLSPWQFYIDTLGLPATTACVDIPSPFDPEQLRVRIIDAVSTRYRDRGRSIAPIACLVGREYEHSPGNYLVFVSSFDYLDRIVEDFTARYPDIPCWHQTRAMRDPEREDFLQRFVADGRGVGFAVLGGVFAEGIDLVGTRLVGVFVATLGLPQVNEVNEEMRRRLDDLFGRGYDYAYLYPGLRKVVQAAGRVIRTETDRGCVWLIDDCYRHVDVRRLLPSWWRIETESESAASMAQYRVARVEPQV